MCTSQGMGIYKKMSDVWVLDLVEPLGGFLFLCRMMKRATLRAFLWLLQLVYTINEEPLE